MPVRLAEFEAGRPALSASQWREELRAGGPLLGLWIASGSATVAELLGVSGPDWVLIDTEHSAQSLEGIVAQLRALESAPTFTVVRAPSKDLLELGRLLDAGVRGLMVPMVESADDARDVVAATRYPPYGRRGVGGAFARATRWNGVSDYLAAAQSAHSVIVQVESMAGIEAVGEIVRVDGVDAVFIGPADLAASASLLGQPRHADVQALVDQAIRIVRNAGGVAGVNAFELDDVARYRAAGASFFGISADVTLLARGAADLLGGVRGSLATSPASGGE